MMIRLTSLLIALYSLSPLAATAVMSIQPTMVLTGAASQLNRPEGIDFSPTGDLMAVANSESNKVTIYKRVGDSGAIFEEVPCCVLEDFILLRFVHDVKFSSCGTYLATISRERHLSVVYKQTEDEGVQFVPYAILEGRPSLIDNPTSVAFSKDLEILALCNRWASGLTFHKSSTDDRANYESIPFWQLSEDVCLEYDLGAPHGIAISNDGKWLAAAHKKFYKNPQAKGKSAIALYRLCNNCDKPIKLPPAQIIYYDEDPLHSIAFHPSGNYLIASKENFGVKLFQKVNKQFVPILEIPIEISQVSPIKHPTLFEGPKGVGFSPSGDCMAITTVMDKVLLYTFQEI